jgi:ribosomal silencing factor RsfS
MSKEARAFYELERLWQNTGARNESGGEQDGAISDRA